MDNFSKRCGLAPVKVEIKPEEMPLSLKNGLWDALRMHYFDQIGYNGNFTTSPSYSDKFSFYARQLQFSFFRGSLDRMPSNPGEYLDWVRDQFFSFPYNEVYDFIEFMLQAHAKASFGVLPERFVELCNHVLEREGAQYRVVGKIFTPVTNPIELAEIDEAITTSPSHAVSQHILTAAILLSRRPQPDFRNSIKESISSVEAAVRFVTGKKTTGISKPLKLIENEFEFHPALRDGFEKIFAFTSDSDGIRHSLMEESSLTRADAKFMLIACSAFSNYLISLKVEDQKP